MSDWQPIETAPRDEVVVMLYCPASWDTEGVRVGWMSEGHWYDCESSWTPLTDIYGQATHWQPLPSPPETKP